jgi:hypothetical protein
VRTPTLKPLPHPFVIYSTAKISSPLKIKRNYLAEKGRKFRREFEII